MRRLAVGMVLILGPLAGLGTLAPTASAHPPQPAPTTQHRALAASEPACDPGTNTNPFFDFKVTLTCLFSGQVFRDPDLKLKADCIAKVGFDLGTDLIPAAKVKLLDKAAVPISRSAKILASDLARTKKFDGKLISSLDNLGKALTLVKHNPRDVVGLFVTSDRFFAGIKSKLGVKDVTALKDLAHLKAETKGLFLELTGIDDAETCVAAFHPKSGNPAPTKPAPQVVFINCLAGGGGISPAPFEAQQQPTSCDLQGQPENLADLLPLQDVQWKNWAQSVTTGVGTRLSTHSGQGGPSSYPVDVSLSQIRRGCRGGLYYTRATWSTPGDPYSETLTILPSCNSVPQPIP